jgi:hypothetical protein
MVVVPAYLSHPFHACRVSGTRQLLFFVFCDVHFHLSFAKFVSGSLTFGGIEEIFTRGLARLDGVIRFTNSGGVDIGCINFVVGACGLGCVKIACADAWSSAIWNFYDFAYYKSCECRSCAVGTINLCQLRSMYLIWICNCLICYFMCHLYV